MIKNKWLINVHTYVRLFFLSLALFFFFGTRVTNAIDGNSEMRTVALHDCNPNGEEYSKDPVTLIVPYGNSIMDIIGGNEWLILESDGANAAECLWYVLDENGEKTLYDLSAPVTENLDLYTFSYTLQIAADEESAEKIAKGITDKKDEGNEATSANASRIRPTATDSDAWELASSSDSSYAKQAMFFDWEDEEDEDDDSDDCKPEDNELVLYAVTKREGSGIEEFLSLADEVALSSENENKKESENSEDNSLSYIDASTGEPINIFDLAKNGLNQNIIAYASVSDSVTVYCYIFVNGEPTLVKTLGSDEVTGRDTARSMWSGSSRYYLAASVLDDVFDAYGFSKDAWDASGTEARIFPHTDTNSTGTIWSDAVPKQNSAGEWCVPISGNVTTSYLYYVPHNVSGYSSYFTQKCAISNETMLADNNFYTVEVTDSGHLAYSSDSEIPEKSYILNGTDLNITLNQSSGDGWFAVGLSSGEKIGLTETKNADGTATITIPKVSENITLTTTKISNEPFIEYSASASSQLVTINSYASGKQSILTDATVRGSQTYSEQLTGEKYVLRYPDIRKVKVSISESDTRRYYYTFSGWKVGSTDTVLPAGTTLTKEEISSYIENGNALKLTAVWTPFDSNGRTATINFFVNLDCEIMDNESNGFSSHHANNYTGSAYSTRIFGSENVSGTGNVQVIASPESADTAYETNATLKNATVTPINGITIEDFPSDEDILSYIRSNNYSISLNDESVAAEDLTSENFSVRWYVLKYETSDAWHIDGVLVAKQARFTVAKTFAGDEEAIAEVQKNYSITVEREDGTQVYTLCLEKNGLETIGGTTGYTNYNEETNTYVWSLSARQDQTYVVKESNYILDDIQWESSYEYKIENSANATNGFVNYDGNGVSITAETYADDVPYTAVEAIVFKNTYVRSGLLTVIKTDYHTGHGLANIPYHISRTDGASIALYRKPDAYMYSADASTAEAEGYTEALSANVVYTDKNGYFFVVLPIGSYYLEEEIPEGYDGAQKILVTVSDDAKLEIASVVIGGTTTEPTNGWISGEGTGTLQIRNLSKMLTSVTAKKEWGDGSEKKEVTVELWRDGAKMNGYSCVLNEENNWQYEWKNLPLFTDGTLAAYTLREVKIGDTIYDAQADTDGYKEYTVNYASALYKEGDDGVYSADASWTDNNGTKHYADHALLTVRNDETGKLHTKPMPETGGYGIAGYLFIGLTLACISLFARRKFAK